MKVKTTGEFIRLGVSLGETGIVEGEGKVLEVSEERFKVLGNANGNPFNTVFVVPYEEKKVEIAKKEDKKETAKPKTRKKAK